VSFIMQLAEIKKLEWAATVAVAFHSSNTTDAAQFVSNFSKCGVESLKRKLDQVVYWKERGRTAEQIIEDGQAKTIAECEKERRAAKGPKKQFRLDVPEQLSPLLERDIERLRAKLGTGSEGVGDFIHTMIEQMTDEQIAHHAGEGKK